MEVLLVGFVFSLLVSAVLAFIERDDTPSRRKYFIKAFGSFFLSILVAGWLMRLLPI